jgi:hypothetical protein
MRSCLTVALVSLALACPGIARAGIWLEGAGGSGDAGPLPASAQIINNAFLTGVGGLMAIEGRLGAIEAPGGVDMYRFTISSPTTFSATTSMNPVLEGGTPLANTQLFLFRLNGIGIAHNDDISGSDRRSTLAAGNSLYASLSAGEYLLAITAFNNDPQSAGGAIFPAAGGGGIFGPTGAGGGSPITGWNSNTSTTGTYRITLTGVAAVPEPATITMLAAGALFALGFRRTRRLAGRLPETPV